MKYKLNRSFFGILYLLIPLVSILIIYIMSPEYLNIYMAVVIAVGYLFIVYVFVKSSKLYIQSNHIILSSMGIKIKINAEDIDEIILTERGFALTALAIKKIKIVKKNSQGKGYLISIKNMDNFIEEIKSLNIIISKDDDSGVIK